MEKISTENLNLLPTPNHLKNICKSISALEAIISPEWEYRYYSYQKDWSIDEEVCEMRDGQGAQMLIMFSEKGVCINGFANESKMNGWEQETKTKQIQKVAEGVLNELPKIFNEFIFGEPIRSIGTTFCVWKTKTDENWITGKVELPKDEYKDGSGDLLQLLDGNPLTYKIWAEEYYEENFEENELKLEYVNDIFCGLEITKDLVKKINPELDDFRKLKSDLDEIGYQNRL